MIRFSCSNSECSQNWEWIYRSDKKNVKYDCALSNADQAESKDWSQIIKNNLYTGS